MTQAGFNGARLKDLRLESGYTQEEIAEKWGVFQQEVSRWETGKQKPDSDRIEKIARFFGVSPAYILGMTDMKVGTGLDLDANTAQLILEAIRNNDLRSYIQLFYLSTDEVDIDIRTTQQILEAIRNKDLNAYIQLFYRVTGLDTQL